MSGIPLKMRYTLLALLFSSAFAQDVPRMAKEAHPPFDVATVKPAEPGERNMPVRSMLMFAFGMQKDQLINLPDWATSDRYYVNGYPDADGRPNVEQFHGTVEKLLADRFGLKFHIEQRELPIYAIRVGKNGPKMKVKADATRLPVDVMVIDKVERPTAN